MATSFKELHQKKENVIKFTARAKAFGWIDDDQEKAIIEKLDSDVLTIGVIGTVKSGKSTFLNAFVFEKDILPTSSTPMTAALSLITYGEKEKIEVEFYNQEDWQKQCELAERSSEGLPEMEAARIQAAKEIVAKSAPIKEKIQEYLGTTREDSLDRIEDYVGADGKFVSITKMVKVFYPKDYLKGVEIVDTPGFNDPIVSRELRTQQFLNKADVVVFLMYAGQVFNAKDRSVLFRDIKQCGVGKVIVGINKYDVMYEKGETPQFIKDYVMDQIRMECDKCHDKTMWELLKDVSPVLLSAEMALLSELPQDVIKNNDSYSHAYHRYTSEPTDSTSGFGIDSYKLREESHIDELADVIMETVEDKYQILLKKPVNEIMATGAKKREEMESALTTTNAEMKILSTPDSELEEKAENLAKAEEKLNTRIGWLEGDLDDAFRETLKKGAYDLEDAIEDTCNSMKRVVESVGVFEDFDNIQPSLQDIANRFEKKTAKRLVDRITNSLKEDLEFTMEDFYNKTEDVFREYIPDVDGEEFIKNVSSKIKELVDDNSIFVPKEELQNGRNFWDYVGDLIDVILAPYLAVVRGIAINPLFHNNNKNVLLNSINDIYNSFNANEYISNLLVCKTNVIDAIKQLYIEKLITPLTQQVNDCKTNLADRADRLAKAKEQSKKLSEELIVIENQLAEIESLKTSMSL